MSLTDVLDGRDKQIEELKNVIKMMRNEYEVLADKMEQDSCRQPIMCSIGINTEDMESDRKENTKFDNSSEMEENYENIQDNCSHVINKNYQLKMLFNHLSINESKLSNELTNWKVKWKRLKIEYDRMKTQFSENLKKVSLRETELESENYQLKEELDNYKDKLEELKMMKENIDNKLEEKRMECQEYYKTVLVKNKEITQMERKLASQIIDNVDMEDAPDSKDLMIHYLKNELDTLSEREGKLTDDINNIYEQCSHSSTDSLTDQKLMENEEKNEKEFVQNDYKIVRKYKILLTQYKQLNEKYQNVYKENLNLMEASNRLHWQMRSKTTSHTTNRLIHKKSINRSVQTNNQSEVALLMKEFLNRMHIEYQKKKKKGKREKHWISEGIEQSDDEEECHRMHNVDGKEEVISQRRQPSAYSPRLSYEMGNEEMKELLTSFSSIDLTSLWKLLEHGTNDSLLQIKNAPIIDDNMRKNIDSEHNLFNDDKLHSARHNNSSKVKKTTKLNTRTSSPNLGKPRKSMIIRNYNEFTE
ncbi:hypothetical protein SNEBB_003059 [Seison nebaliae]|nr:hypothetical protein SNEBB_003059 [Seison nebaliae]